jgi:hypothetical protein
VAERSVVTRGALPRLRGRGEQRNITNVGLRSVPLYVAIRHFSDPIADPADRCDSSSSLLTMASQARLRSKDGSAFTPLAFIHAHLSTRLNH